MTELMRLDDHWSHVRVRRELLAELLQPVRIEVDNAVVSAVKRVALPYG
jgi:hypothetical protein